MPFKFGHIVPQDDIYTPSIFQDHGGPLNHEIFTFLPFLPFLLYFYFHLLIMSPWLQYFGVPQYVIFMSLFAQYFKISFTNGFQTQTYMVILDRISDVFTFGECGLDNKLTGVIPIYFVCMIFPKAFHVWLSNLDIIYGDPGWNLRSVSFW